MKSGLKRGDDDGFLLLVRTVWGPITWRVFGKRIIQGVFLKSNRNSNSNSFWIELRLVVMHYSIMYYLADTHFPR